MLEGAARAAQVRDTRSETGVVYLLEIKASVFDRFEQLRSGSCNQTDECCRPTRCSVFE